MRRFWAFVVMVVSLLVMVVFNVQSVVDSNNLSLGYQGGKEAVLEIDRRSNGVSLSEDDISTKIMARLDTAGARESKVEVTIQDSETAQVRVTLNTLNSNEFNNILRVVEGNGPLTFSTSDDYTVSGDSIFDGNDPMELKYNSTTPIPCFVISKTTAWDDLVSHAKSGTTDETLQKTIYVWQNKTDDDTYAYGVGDNKRDDVAKKIIATLSTDNYNNSSSDDVYISISADENGNDFTISSARSYVNARNSTDYGFDIKYLYEDTIAATYPSSSLMMSYIGTGVGLVLLLVGLVLLYGVSGGVAGLSIAFGTLFQMMVSNFLGFEFAPITIVSILISILLGLFITCNYFQRVKSEIRRGKSIDSANTEAYRKSFTVTWVSCLMTFFLALFAFLIGQGVIKSFAGVLIVGTVTDFLFVNYFNKWMTYWITTSSVFSKSGRTFGLSEKNNALENVFAKKDYVNLKKNGKGRLTGYFVALGVICLAVIGTFLGYGLTGGVSSFYNNSEDYADTYRVNISYVLTRDVADDKTFTTFSQFEKYITDSTYFEDGFTSDEILTNNFSKVETISGESYLNPENTYTYYISFTVATPTTKEESAKLETKVAAIRSDFEGGTELYNLDYPSFTTVSVSSSVTHSGQAEHNNFWLYLAMGMTVVFAIVFFMMLYGFYASMAVAAIEGAEFGLGLAILSISRLPFNSASMFGIFAGLFVTTFALIPVFQRMREIKRDSKNKKPDMLTRKNMFNQAMKESITSVAIPHIGLVIMGIFTIAFSSYSSMTLGVMMIVMAVASFVLISLFLSTIYLFASKLSVKSPEKLRKLAMKKPIQVNKNEPHETIIPGIND